RAGAGNQLTLVFVLEDRYTVGDVFDLAQRDGIDDGDSALALRRRVDAVHHEVISARVVDRDAGVPIRDAQRAVAGADDLPGQRDASALRHDVVDHDRAVGGIEILFDRHAVGAERNPRQRV